MDLLELLDLLGLADLDLELDLDLVDLDLELDLDLDLDLDFLEGEEDLDLDFLVEEELEGEVFRFYHDGYVNMRGIKKTTCMMGV